MSEPMRAGLSVEERLDELERVQGQHANWLQGTATQNGALRTVESTQQAVFDLTTEYRGDRDRAVRYFREVVEPELDAERSARRRGLILSSLLALVASGLAVAVLLRFAT